MAVAETRECIPLSSVIHAFTPQYFLGLIDLVLQYRNQASGGVLKELNSAINQGIKVRGFRYSSKAQPSQLRELILKEFAQGNDRLTGEVLRAWVESRKGLHSLVEGQLQSRNIPVAGPNRRDGVFNSHWRMNEWKEVVDTISLRDPVVDRDDVRMMVSYVSGMAERVDVSSQPLSECIDRLRRIDIEDPDWQDIDDFEVIVQEIADKKAQQRTEVLTERCVNTLQQTQRDFETELQYLELDIAAWEEEASKTPAAIATALRLVEALRENLEAYQCVRPQAESKSKEAERARARDQLEAAISQVADEWQGIFDVRVDGKKGETIPLATSAPHETNGPAGEQADSTPTVDENQDLLAMCQRLKGERDSYSSENYRLHSENSRLAAKNAGLEADKESLYSENKELKTNLSDSRDLGDYWRQFFAASEQLGCVDDAVSRAKELFPKQLVFALNSKSDKGSPFQKPEEVFAALAWLATDYHHLRWASAGEEPRFDERLKESCSGWSYKPHQGNTTKKQFREWYTTDYQGHTYELGKHIGKGNSGDPQKTIRIAFAWDEERSQVIVGYIGRHQKTQSS